MIALSLLLASYFQEDSCGHIFCYVLCCHAADSAAWNKLKPDTKADIEKVLKEEFERCQQADDPPVVGGSCKLHLHTIPCDESITNFWPDNKCITRQMCGG